MSRNIPLLQNYDIYRGSQKDLVEKPIPQAEHYLDTLGSFEARMKHATIFGIKLGLLGSLLDVAYHTKIRDIRAASLRIAFLTTPVVFSTTGYVAALEIANKLSPDTKVRNYTLSTVIPAAVYSTWRRRPHAFPKVLVALGPLAMFYSNGVEENWNFGLYSTNPNEPAGGSIYKPISWLDQHEIKSFARTDLIYGKTSMQKDPGPSYAKWEQ
eukprot:TRINITY_DN842_c0_g1_i10.p1 TRINITY_DN842_c0_g1~~TRINITY_DN842_c0_g1_i10.p1  ORF type:complete len:212 (-),score=25.47 TRINITY_DN842_c0_g1_i10:402-1037(-)